MDVIRLGASFQLVSRLETDSWESGESSRRAVYRGEFGLSMTNIQLPSGRRRTTSVLTPCVADGGPSDHAPWSTANPSPDSMTARVSSFMRAPLERKTLKAS